MKNPNAHFDIGALCAQVLEQDLGLIITTNNPGGFRRILYTHMRKHPAHKLTISQDPRSPNRFMLLKSPPAAELSPREPNS